MQVAISLCCWRDLPDVILRIFPWMPEPIPRRVAECVCLVLPQPSSAFPIIRLGRLPARLREHDFPRVGFRGCSYFVMFKPPSLLASQIVPTAASFPCRAAEVFTSEQNVRRCLRTHRTCYPPDYRQLAERGLSPRKIRSLVGCSVGIELGRASGRRRVTRLALSVTRWVPSSAMAAFPQAPL